MVMVMICYSLQIVLDYTYVDETKLVDELFPQDTCKERIHTIFGNKISFKMPLL